MPDISNFDFSEDPSTDNQSTPFAEKMELVRLQRPCPLSIDMRGKVAGLCKAYDFNGRTFFMDDASIQIFEEKLVQNDGVFTQGAYEAVHDGPHTLKSIRQQREQRYAEQEEAREQAPRISMIDFGLEHKRKQTRFGLITNLVIKTKDNSYFGTTKDISLDGLYVLIPLIYTLHKGDTIHLSFVNDIDDYVLEEELSKLPKIPYQVIRVHEKGEKLALALRRIVNPVDDLDLAYLKGIIQSKKNRLQTDHKELASQQHTKAYRRCYSDSSPAITLFYKLEDQETQLICSGISHENQALHQFFQVEKNRYDYSVLNDSRWVPTLVRSAIERNLPSSSIVTVYRLKGDDLRLHVLASEQLQSLKPFSLIWHYLKNQAMFRVFRLTISPAPSFPSDRLRELIEPTLPAATISDMNMIDSLISKIHAVGSLSDITDEVSRAIAIRSVESDASSLKESLNNHVGHELLHAYPQYNPQSRQIEFGYHRKRIEHRYQIEIEVTVTLFDRTFQATTIDLSRRGLQLRLHQQSGEFYSGQRVTLKFNGLLKRTDVNLKAVPYKIVAVENGTILKLSRFSYSKEDQQVDAFFDRLIESNSDNLPMDMEDLYEEAMAAIYEEMMSAVLQSIPLFFARDEEGHIYLESIATTPQRGGLLDYFIGQNGQLDLTFLDELGMPHFLRETLRGSEDGRATITILSYRSLLSGDLIAVLERELFDPDDLQEFINQMVKNKSYRVLQLSVRYLPYYTEHDLQKMIMPLYHKSLSHAKRVLLKLEKLTVVGDINDITKEYFAALRTPLS